MKWKGQIPVMKTIMGIILAAILVLWFARFMGILGQTRPEDCCNGKDDNGNGKVDAFDPKCQEGKDLKVGENKVCFSAKGGFGLAESGWFRCPSEASIENITFEYKELGMLSGVKEKFNILDEDGTLYSSGSVNLQNVEKTFSLVKEVQNVKFKIQFLKLIYQDSFVNVSSIFCSEEEEGPSPTLTLKQLPKYGEGEDKITVEYLSLNMDTLNYFQIRSSKTLTDVKIKIFPLRHTSGEEVDPRCNPAEREISEIPANTDKKVCKREEVSEQCVIWHGTAACTVNKEEIVVKSENYRWTFCAETEGAGGPDLKQTLDVTKGPC